jgi:RNA polymerase sigma factor (sigma-70 family)
LVQRRAIDFVRRSRRQATECLPHDEACALATQEQDPAAILERQWDQEVVRIAMDQLRSGVSEVNYRIIEMHYFQGKTVAEIARALGMTEDQVNGRQRRMLKALRPIISFYRGGFFAKDSDEAA